MALKAHLDPVPPCGAGADNRSDERRALLLETSGVLPSGLAANVVVHNISAAGLLLETDLPLTRGEQLTMHLPQTGAVVAVIVWQSERLFGCAFERALSESTLAAVQLRSTQPEGETQAMDGEADVEADVETGQPPPRAVESGLPPEALGPRLNRLRRERGMTLAQVAEALSVSKPTVWAWEKGKARPVPERLEPIAQVLGVTVKDLEDTLGQYQNSALVEECRLRIATAYGTQPTNIRIMIEV
ncbi:MAG: helix-turn-helix domain-containing protein [Pseudomonadota bacterium]